MNDEKEKAIKEALYQVEELRAILDAVRLLRQLPEKHGYYEDGFGYTCTDNEHMHEDADTILLQLLDTLAPDVSREWRRLDEMAAHFWYS